MIDVEQQLKHDAYEDKLFIISTTFGVFIVVFNLLDFLEWVL